MSDDRDEDDDEVIPDSGECQTGTIADAQPDERPSPAGPESMEPDPEEPPYSTSFDVTEVPLTVAVVAAVSEVADEDPLDLEPLHSSVDTEALAELVSGRRAFEEGVHVTFTFYGYYVTVSSYGRITVRE